MGGARVLSSITTIWADGIFDFLSARPQTRNTQGEWDKSRHHQCVFMLEMALKGHLQNLGVKKILVITRKIRFSSLFI